MRHTTSATDAALTIVKCSHACHLESSLKRRRRKKKKPCLRSRKLIKKKKGKKKGFAFSSSFADHKVKDSLVCRLTNRNVLCSSCRRPYSLVCKGVGLRWVWGWGSWFAVGSALASESSSGCYSWDMSAVGSALASVFLNVL